MKLVDLDPWFIRLETRPCKPGPNCSVVSPHTKHDYQIKTDFAHAEGILFLCPKCFIENKGVAGTHSVICWRPCVPDHVEPKPGRWEFQGTGFSDLTLVAHQSSVHLTGEGCGAHFRMEKGEIRFC
jgi:hypothetical protein